LKAHDPVTGLNPQSLQRNRWQIFKLIHMGNQPFGVFSDMNMSGRSIAFQPKRINHCTALRGVIHIGLSPHHHHPHPIYFSGAVRIRSVDANAALKFQILNSDVFAVFVR